MTRKPTKASPPTSAQVSDSPSRRRDTSSREMLLDTASALMSEGGSVDFSFVDISARSGLNSALVRYHFGGKEGLLLALLERDAGGTFEALETLVKSDLDAASKLRRHVEGVIKIYHRYPYMNRLIGALGSETNSTTARFISEHFTRPLAEAQRAILEQGIAEGVFRPIDPVLFYFSVIGACDHLFHARSALKHAFGIDTITDDLRRSYADHLTGILLGSIMISPNTVLQE